MRIVHRVLLAVVLISIVVFGAAVWLASRAQERALAAEVERHALVLSETIENSTRHAMMLNERQMVHRIIELVGGQESLERIRVFNKDGTVIYSPQAETIGTRVDTRSEACDGCHRAGARPGELPGGGRTREFVDASGTHQLGVINPITNDASCATASCHVHPAEQRVLGVLDVTVSLTEVDRAVARSRRELLGLALLATLVFGVTLWAIFERLVGGPVSRLVAATNAVAAGDLGHRIPVARRDELGQLALSFNEMTAHLAEARHQVYQSNKLASLGRLAAGIAHEINNPLTGVLTYSSFLLKRASDAETREDLDTIVRETKRCRDIVRGLLDFARQVPPKKARIDLNEVVARALDIVDNQLRVQNIRVTTRLAEDLPLLLADGNQLQQVLINLLVNAADALESEPREIFLATDLESRDGGRWIEVKVSDTGSGISEKDLGKIFEPFFTTKAHKGTGLGLAVVWGIVNEHGGQIEVDSKVGRGTTFTVLLPIGEATGVVEAAA